MAYADIIYDCRGRKRGYRLVVHNNVTKKSARVQFKRLYPQYKIIEIKIVRDCETNRKRNM